MRAQRQPTYSLAVCTSKRTRSARPTAEMTSREVIELAKGELAMVAADGRPVQFE